MCAYRLLVGCKKSTVFSFGPLVSLLFAPGFRFVKDCMAAPATLRPEDYVPDEDGRAGILFALPP